MGCLQNYGSKQNKQLTLSSEIIKSQVNGEVAQFTHLEEKWAFHTLLLHLHTHMHSEFMPARSEYQDTVRTTNMTNA